MKLVAGTALPFFAEVADHHSLIVGLGLSPLRSLGAGEPDSSQYTGVKALMLAVLEEAIRNYLGRDARLRRDAAYWIACPGHASPFAFATVCETLGLEPGAVRDALYRLGERDESFNHGVGRSRPNVRNGRRLLARKSRPRPKHPGTATRAGNGAMR
jgi:hypothetical protein